jgi:hypothetical protein
MDNHSSMYVNELAEEVTRLSSLVNELTLQCVLNGVDLPDQLASRRPDLSPPTLDLRFRPAFRWAFDDPASDQARQKGEHRHAIQYCNLYG